MELHMSSANATGYKNVLRSGNHFVVSFSMHGKKHRIGEFGTALSAAVAYAKMVIEPQAADNRKQPPRAVSFACEQGTMRARVASHIQW